MPGSLVLSSTLIDLGPSKGAAVLNLTNPGGLAVDWVVSGPLPEPFTLTIKSGRLQPGQQQSITVSINRDKLPEGSLERTFTIADATSSPAPSFNVTLRASVERAPILVLDGPAGPLSACNGGAPPVVVDYTDESAIFFPATIEWTGPESGNTQLKPRGNLSVYGNIVITGTAPGSYSYTVFVTDVRGNLGTASGGFTIDPCPN